MSDDGLDVQAWAEETAKGNNITLAQLDELCIQYKKASDKYDEAKLVSTEAYNEKERLKGKVIEALELTGKSKYVVDGVGTVSLKDSLSVRVPPTIEQKKMLFDFIEQKYGDTVLWDKISINSRTLNSFYNSELEIHQELVKKGEASGDFHFPGLDAPTAQRDLKLLKEKKK